MGKGDRKTKRGKIWRGTFGNTRPHKAKQLGATLPGAGPAAGASKAATVKKAVKPTRKAVVKKVKAAVEPQELTHVAAESAIPAAKTPQKKVAEAPPAKKAKSDSVVKKTKAPATKKAKPATKKEGEKDAE